MMRIRVSAEDLAHTRFAFSALWETVASYRALRKPEKHPLHLPWMREARAAIAGLDLAVIDALLGPNGCYLDFLTPPPTTPLPDFHAELERLLATPAAAIERDIGNLRANRSKLPANAIQGPLEPFLIDPRGSLEQLVEALERYWEAALAAHWPRLRALLEADVMYRARRFALEGPERLLDELHPLVRYRAGRLEIAGSCAVDLDLSGRGLLLIPSVFMDYTLMFEPPWQETIQYGARGTAGLWCDSPAPAEEALEKLLGSTRARLLRQLLTPSTTSQLAHQFRVTPGAVSQHLAWLRAAGLVGSRRNGRSVYYTLSPIGEGLLEAYRQAEKRAAAPDGALPGGMLVAAP